MEENEVKILKNSKMNIARMGKWMNIFSIFAVLSMILLVALGVVALFVSGMMDEATAHYLDNVIGFSGIGLIVVAAALLPTVVFMRHSVRAARQIRATNELYPLAEFARQQRHLWHYTALLLVIGFVIALLASVAAAIVYWPYLQIAFGL